MAEINFLAPCIIANEACASSFYWQRRFEAAGHKVRIIAPQYVKPFVKHQKNDRNDAAAICRALKRSDSANGFVVLPRRWVVECTLAWLNRNRRLAKDFEQTIASATAWLFIASIQLFACRIARLCNHAG
jgi:transposase